MRTGAKKGKGDAELPDAPERLGADLASVGDATKRETDPYQRDSLHAEEALRRANDVARAGDESAAVEEYLRAAKIAETAREWYVAAVALQRVAEFLEAPPGPADLERSLRTYRRAAFAYDQCGLHEESRQVGYRAQWLKLRRGGELGVPWSSRAELALFWLTAGFGYRPLRVLAAAAVIVAAFALAYFATGGVRHASGEPAGLLDSLYFSAVTFTTVGYGDMVPAPHARPLAMAEGAVGAFTIGFFVVVLSKRLRH